mmetsp:Transcript_8153/g.13151  ORF Transcript_8153/g.13151 Transcript_8153/m.13151 type:complete len:204 (+) Transcript_8153:67-678(+)|eukprot:CAMPEP_0203770222 /NCGR_PEP_ID=MMETSP0099_2-20121227/2666_1 /ASSEMBLY_ACC=CAM_ASM_000209 /TAXON_ID=96639 /ORGANISM=" , Strain NY0313808BC1" /LENGTH=203 /DNA_ID=CAMNT_0050667285 /DNA_START=44 /DNA_END=655 /DNA_ORIENTATION=-
MVKHNNVVPNAHFHKDWQNRVKVTLDQPMRKLRRRLKRKQKAEAIAPRPVAGLLRPVVRCATQRYNTKVRAGRGFTLQELREAKISPKLAPTIGIAVDHRRRNKCVESLQLNVQRLKEYQARLIVFPRKGGKIKKGDATVEETNAATQLKGALMPVTQPKVVVETMAITDDMRKKSAVYELRQAKASQYIEGKRRHKKDDEEE